MYRLIIVDDEKLIRNGLSRYVEDNVEEFDVAGEFDDGVPALEYLLSNIGDVDVVIADIKMKNMSGIELAQQIRNHNIDVKIVFISGYEEFEYARKAIEYKVFSYLLKPLRFEQLDNMFQELVKELDGKEKTDAGISGEMQCAMTIHLIHEMEIGTTYGETEIRKRAKILHLPQSLLETPCGYITVRKSPAADGQEKYTVDQFDTAIVNLFDNSRYYIYKIHTNKSMVTFFVSVKGKPETAEFSRKLTDVLDTIVYQAADSLNLGIEIIGKEFFENIFSFSDYFMSSSSNDAIENIKNVFFTDLTIGDFEEAEKSFELLEEKLSALGKVHRDLILEDFMMLINRISGSRNERAEEKAVSIADIERNKSDDYKEQILSMAMEYINENYCCEVSLIDVAEHVHLNPVYLGRIFKQRFGETVMDCIIRIKMQKAKEMLVNTDKKVKEIAQLVGYSNENYFITTFKKNTGMTPGKYRLEKRL